MGPHCTGTLLGAHPKTWDFTLRGPSWAPTPRHGTSLYRDHLIMTYVGCRVSHTTISLICMSTYKATRCLSYHQATSGQPAIWSLATAPLRRLALSVLFTITSTSYQTTCTVSERSSIKGTCQCKPTQCRLLALRHWPSMETCSNLFTSGPPHRCWHLVAIETPMVRANG